MKNFDLKGILFSVAQGKKPNTFTDCRIQGRTGPYEPDILRNGLRVTRSNKILTRFLLEVVTLKSSIYISPFVAYLVTILKALVTINVHLQRCGKLLCCKINAR